MPNLPVDAALLEEQGTYLVVKSPKMVKQIFFKLPRPAGCSSSSITISPRCSPKFNCRGYARHIADGRDFPSDRMKIPVCASTETCYQGIASLRALFSPTLSAAIPPTFQWPDQNTWHVRLPASPNSKGILTVCHSILVSMPICAN